MRRYLVSRLAQGVIVILMAVLVTFVLTSVIGNPIDALVGSRADAATRARLAHERGYDHTIVQQFGDYVAGAVRGDFGTSYQQSDRSAIGLVADALPYTAILVLAAMATSCLLGVPVALLSVLRRGSRSEIVLRRLLMTLQGVPQFYVALLLVLVFAIDLQVLPSIGIDSGPASYVLPVLALSLPLGSSIARLLRSELLDVLGSEFVTALRAKGLTRREIVFGHAMRNALPSVVTYLGLQVGDLIAGTVLVEAVFAIPGLGSLALSATDTRDLPVLQAVILTIATGYVLANLSADLTVRTLDPRLREARG